MKKLLSALLAVSLLVSASAVCFTVSAAVPGIVGEINTDNIAPGFENADLKKLTLNFKAEYDRTSKLQNSYHNGKLFQFGTSTEEKVHKWAGDLTNNGCMAQDFVGGNSSCTDVFSYTGQRWAVILCTNPQTLECFTVRDEIAKAWGDGGGTNNQEYGMPISNQFWVKDAATGEQVLYQLFQNGYVKAPNGSSTRLEFVADTAFKKPAGATDDFVNPDNPTTSTPTPSTPSDGPTPSTGDPVVTTSGIISDLSSVESATGDLSSDASDISSDTSGAGTASDLSSDDGEYESQLNVGATVGMIIAAVVVLGGGVFALYWFVLRKKKDGEAEGEESAEGEEPAENAETPDETKDDDKKDDNQDNQ